MTFLKKHAMTLAAFCIAMIFGVVTSGFAIFGNNDRSSEQEIQEWRYMLSTETGQDNPNNYELADGNESCPGGATVVCIIEAPNDGNDLPDLTKATPKSFKK